MTMFWKIKENLHGEELCKWERKKLLSHAISGITSWFAIIVIQTWEDLQSPARAPASAKKQSCHHKSGRQFSNYQIISQCRLFSANSALHERGTIPLQRGLQKGLWGRKFWALGFRAHKSDCQRSEDGGRCFCKWVSSISE